MPERSVSVFSGQLIFGFGILALGASLPEDFSTHGHVGLAALLVEGFWAKNRSSKILEKPDQSSRAEHAPRRARRSDVFQYGHVF